MKRGSFGGGRKGRGQEEERKTWVKIRNTQYLTSPDEELRSFIRICSMWKGNARTVDLSSVGCVEREWMVVVQ